MNDSFNLEDDFTYIFSGYVRVTCMYMYVCFWPPVSTTFPNYEAVEFQHHAVDIIDLGYGHQFQ